MDMHRMLSCLRWFYHLGCDNDQFENVVTKINLEEILKHLSISAIFNFTYDVDIIAVYASFWSLKSINSNFFHLNFYKNNN